MGLLRNEFWLGLDPSRLGYRLAPQDEAKPKEDLLIILRWPCPSITLSPHPEVRPPFDNCRPYPEVRGRPSSPPRPHPEVRGRSPSLEGEDAGSLRIWARALKNEAAYSAMIPNSGTGGTNATHGNPWQPRISRRNRRGWREASRDGPLQSLVSICPGSLSRCPHAAPWRGKRPLERVSRQRKRRRLQPEP